MNALLRYGLFVIAICTALDGILFLALGYRYACSLLFHVDPTELETPSTYINFDLLLPQRVQNGLSIPYDPGSPPCTRASLLQRARQNLPTVASVVFGAVRHRAVQRSPFARRPRGK